MILGPSILKKRFDERGQRVVLYKICAVTKLEYSVVLTLRQYETLKSSACPSIQNFLPDFSPEQREFLMTGITPGEWNQMFPPKD